MSNEEKKTQFQQVEAEDLGDLDFTDEVTYRPCKMCHSMDYDLSDGDLDPDGVYEPHVCDQCGMGNITKSKITLH